MKVYEIEFDYLWKPSDENSQSYSEYLESVERRRLLMTRLDVRFDDDEVLTGIGRMMVNSDQLLELVEAKEKVKVLRAIPVMSAKRTIESEINRMTETPESRAVYNEVVQVHMPGYTLATYNATMLLQDACTDALQSALDDGWRIVAALPQPDQRRPDYVLGRYDPNHEAGKAARRST